MMDFVSGHDSLATRTRIEIQDTATEPGSVLVVPVGSIEQHGHHLPVATDTLLAAAIAELGASRVGDDQPVLVAPPVWTGYSPHHLSLGGTLSIGADTLQAILEDLADSASTLGFDGVLLVNGHGGNASLVDLAVSTIGTTHPDLEVAAVTYFELATSFIDEIRESDPGGMAHGGEFETALMLHLYPDLVREDAIQGTPLDDPYDRGATDLLDGGEVTSYRPFEAYSESGAIGEPALATEANGATITERLGDELAGVIENVHEQACGR